jgi:hypothetical protein
MNLVDQQNKYNQILSNYLKETPGKMFTLEITKCCDYSTFVFVYRDERLVDLYSRVSHHFGHDIVSLYILTPDKERICVPINSTTTIKEFIFKQTDANNRKMTPIYDLPMPVVYRIYVDDGHDHNHKCSS